jgi:hypothetical protein
MKSEGFNFGNTTANYVRGYAGKFAHSYKLSRFYALFLCDEKK